MPGIQLQQDVKSKRYKVGDGTWDNKYLVAAARAEEQGRVIAGGDGTMARPSLPLRAHHNGWSSGKGT